MKRKFFGTTKTQFLFNFVANFVHEDNIGFKKKSGKMVAIMASTNVVITSVMKSNSFQVQIS